MKYNIFKEKILINFSSLKQARQLQQMSLKNKTSLQLKFVKCLICIAKNRK